MDLARELKKLWNMMVTVIPTVIGAFSNKEIIKGTGGFGSWKTSGDHPKYNIIENSQNTGKSPEDLRRIAVTQIPVKNRQLKLM